MKPVTCEKERTTASVRSSCFNRKINVREEMIRNLSMQVQQTAVQIRESSEKITAMEANPESMCEDLCPHGLLCLCERQGI